MGHDVGRDTRVERILSPGTYLRPYVRISMDNGGWMDRSQHTHTPRTHARSLALLPLQWCVLVSCLSFILWPPRERDVEDIVETAPWSLRGYME